MADLSAALEAEGVETLPLATLLHEPEVADVDRVAAEVRTVMAEGDFLLAVGGGAAIDLAKAAAAMATNRQGDTVKDYLEGRRPGAEHRPAAAAGAGDAHDGRHGRRGDEKRGHFVATTRAFKKSLRDDRLVPRIALVDPELTVSVPPPVTAASGMDAITQLIESYVSRKRAADSAGVGVPGTEAGRAGDCRSGGQRRRRGLRAKRCPMRRLLSGMALANSGLGMAHGVAAAWGRTAGCRTVRPAPSMLPAAIRANLDVARSDFARLDHLLFGGSAKTPHEAAAEFSDEIEKLCDRVGVPRRLGDVGVTREQIPAIVKDSRGSSMSGNPRELSDEELTRILEELL